MLDELSGRVSQVAPAAINEHVRIWEKSVPPNAFSEYVRDFWQRSVLFLDILRERGNQHQEMLAHGVSSVLMYDSELVMRGDKLPHPVIIPPEGAEIDDRKRPVFVIDPRRPGTGNWRLQAVERDRGVVQGRASCLFRRLYGFASGGAAN